MPRPCHRRHINPQTHARTCTACRLYVTNAAYRKAWGGPETLEPIATPIDIDRQIRNTTFTWAYGITTVPARGEDLLLRTMASLKGAGFDSPTIFLDGGDANLCNSYKHKFGLEVVGRHPTIGAYGNWILALAELYIRHPNAERYALFQDDFITYRNLRDYLNGCYYPDHGYMNLYTFPKNQRLAPRADSREQKVGWYTSDQRGKGAVALVFNHACVLELLSSGYMVKRPMDPRRGNKFIDGGVVSAMREIGWQEWVHHPSLVQHTGLKSTIGNPQHQPAISFMGEHYDAMCLFDLQKLPSDTRSPAPIRTPVHKRGLGDTVEKALTSIGITKERVEAWVGRPCGCRERREKLNNLGRWAMNLLRGNSDQQELEKMIE